jgi:uncharacterized protein with HEPN domain
MSLPDRVRLRHMLEAAEKLIHGYFSVDLNIVWQIVSVDIPPLIIELKSILATSP